MDIYHAAVMFANGYIMGRHSCVFFFLMILFCFIFIFLDCLICYVKNKILNLNKKYFKK